MCLSGTEWFNAFQPQVILCLVHLTLSKCDHLLISLLNAVFCVLSFLLLFLLLSFCILPAQGQWNCWGLWPTVLPNSSLPAYPTLCQNWLKCSQIPMWRCRMQVSRLSGRLGLSSGIQRSWVRTVCISNTLTWLWFIIARFMFTMFRIKCKLLYELNYS